MQPFCRPAVKNLQHEDTENVFMLWWKTIGVTSLQFEENTNKQPSADTMTLVGVATDNTLGLELVSPLGSMVASVTTS